MSLWDKTAWLPRPIGLIRTTVVAMAFLASPLVWAQEPKTPTPKELKQDLQTGQRPASVTVEAIMEQAVHNISVRYNLNDKQTEITRKMMRDGVFQFLEEHEKDVWPIIRDLLTNGFRAPENSEDKIRIGKAAGPLFEAAKQKILEANDQWRTILSDEQIRVHDFDMAEMRDTFDEIDKRFSEWETGQAPAQQPLFPTPDMGRDLERPSRPGEKDVIVEVFDPKHIFEKFVEQFIKDYELDEGQVTAAKSILEEFKVKAEDYRTSKKQEFTDIAARQQLALDNKDLAAVKTTHAEHKKLLEPVYQLYSQMEDRLKGLLTSAQIQKYAEKIEARKRRPATRTASAAKVKPVSPKKTTDEKAPDNEAQPKTAAKTPETESQPEGSSDR